MSTLRPGAMQDGFNLIARDLHRALSLAIDNRFVGVLLQTAMERSFIEPTRQGKKNGEWPDPEPFGFVLAELSREKELGYRSLQRALKWLIDARIFLSAGPEHYLINKDYRTWLDPDDDAPVGKRLLSDRQIADCLAAKTLGRGLPATAKRQSSESVLTGSSDFVSVRQNCRSAYDKTVAVHTTDLSQCPVGARQICRGDTTDLSLHLRQDCRGEHDSFVVFPPVAIEERARQRDQGDEREKGRPIRAPYPQTPAATGPETEDRLVVPLANPEAIAEDGPPVEERNPGPKRNSPEAIELATWAADTIGQHWGTWANSRCDDYPASWIKGVLKRYVDGQAKPKNGAYLDEILARSKAEGECRYDAAAPAGGEGHRAAKGHEPSRSRPTMAEKMSQYMNVDPKNIKLRKL